MFRRAFPSPFPLTVAIVGYFLCFERRGNLSERAGCASERARPSREASISRALFVPSCLVVCLLNWLQAGYEFIARAAGAAGIRCRGAMHCTGVSMNGSAVGVGGGRCFPRLESLQTQRTRKRKDTRKQANDRSRRGLPWGGCGKRTWVVRCSNGAGSELTMSLGINKRDERMGVLGALTVK